MQYFIGIDVGTTNTKAYAIGSDNVLIHKESIKNHTFSLEKGHQEQNPAAVFKGVLTVLKKTIAVCKHLNLRLEGICFSSAMHSLIAFDKKGQPLIDAMLWSDLRAYKEVNKFKQLIDYQQLILENGTPAHPMSPFFKMAWLKENQANLFEKIAFYGSLKTYIWQQFFQEIVMDISDASASGLMHTKKMQWSTAALDYLEIKSDKLPLLCSPYYLQKLSQKWCKILGCPPETPLIIGASDGALANLGAGISDPNTLVMTIGTSAALRNSTKVGKMSDNASTFCYRLDEEIFIEGAASNNGANCLDWLKNQVFESPEPMEKFIARAQKSPKNSEGLSFLPYIYGERAPIWDANATGTFSGIKHHHKKAHFIRATMEGILNNLHTVFYALPNANNFNKIVASGGFTQNNFWLDMAEDIFQLPIEKMPKNGVDLSGLGAVLMGRKALNSKIMYA
jgi:gluconokinase